jgi:hypothetical protein
VSENSRAGEAYQDRLAEKMIDIDTTRYSRKLEHYKTRKGFGR